jgi:hypothetical protein
MKRHYYSDSIHNFCKNSIEEIIGQLTLQNEFSSERTQTEAWVKQIEILQPLLSNFDGQIFFEYAIPRMGKRIDAVVIIKNVIFILEFKVGEKDFLQNAIEQVWDYALDLKNFHETSYNHLLAPILIATKAKELSNIIESTSHNDNLLKPIKASISNLNHIINSVLNFSEGETIDPSKWSLGKYSPTPTIIEAAMALYNGNSVANISRSDASAQNLSHTSNAISSIINSSKEKCEKAICFVTGVPGAGKTLVGLNIATKHFNKENGQTSVYLSGNGPLVSILREALTRDKVKRLKSMGEKIKKGEVLSEVKLFIQNVHHFRDECLIDEISPPFDHVAIFDEAQRAWNKEMTTNFMSRKKSRPGFEFSEPEFLISCLNRHKDWAVVVCLVGGGQEINTGEAGISEWIDSLNRSFPEWKVYISNQLSDTEYAAGHALEKIKEHRNVILKPELHLSVSLRSFRAENLSILIKNILDLNDEIAKNYLSLIVKKYPIVLSRNLKKAKQWLREKARGTERYGLIVSSQAQRLKPHAIDVKSPMDPIHWFLDEKEDVRSSYYMEDVATEFQVQGLELDWTCVTWDADFRYSKNGWESFSFVGNKWQNIRKDERKQYLKNAYRVLLTRARQGMVIVVPEGDDQDPTRKKDFYDSTYNYLHSIGFEVL